MNKKCTFFMAALLAVGSFTVHAADSEVVKSNGWAVGNYFYLKNGDKYLAIDAGNQDSVIIQTNLANDKVSADLALWEITNVGTEITGNVFQFVNKRTKKVLSFAKSADAEPVLATGINKWAFSETGVGEITAKLSNSETMKFAIDGTKLVFKGGTVASFSVIKPEDNFPVSAKDLENGFTTFQLSLGEKIEGDIFGGKDLIATEDKDGYIKLQQKGSEAYGNGVKKYVGIDTLKIDGADKLADVFGYSFSLDSVRTMAGKKNETSKLFKFTVDLKNDSLTMIVKSVPDAPDKQQDVRVIYVKLDDKKVLTVADSASKSAIYPHITTKRGTPASITTGTGAYFLKSGSKGADGGKYVVSINNNKITTMSGMPSVNLLEGQWYIKEEGGLYSIVDRLNGKTLLSKGEVFAVQDMPNTYTLEGRSDTITVEYRKEVDLTNKFLGSLHFTKDQLANNGYALNLVPESSGTSLYVLTSGNDPALKIKEVDIKEANIFKLLPSDTVEVGGAKSLGDVVSVIYYKLKTQFSNDSIALVSGKSRLQMSGTETAVEFRFVSNAAGTKYSMEANGQFVSSDINTQDMILSDNIAYFNLEGVEAREYGTFSPSHKRFTSDALSLTMNPLNFFAEMKQEGLEITKSAYEKDNFSLILIAAKASTPEKPLYYIATSLPKDPEKPTGERVTYYLVSGRDSSIVDTENHYRVNFIANDTIETMKNDANNPALFAFKLTENGSYLLENQKEAGLSNGTPYINVYGKNVIMSKNGLEYAIENAPVPTKTEEIKSTSYEVYGSTGEVIVRNAAGKKITLSNILGQNVGTRMATSDFITIPATRGVIIVSADGEAAKKVIVK